MQLANQTLTGSKKYKAIDAPTPPKIGRHIYGKMGILVTLIRTNS